MADPVDPKDPRFVAAIDLLHRTGSTEFQIFRRGCEGEHDEKQIRALIAGRNDPCPCGSGTKFKRCCGA